MADWDMLKEIPIQVRKLMNTGVSIEIILRPINFASGIYACAIVSFNQFNALSINFGWSIDLQPAWFFKSGKCEIAYNHFNFSRFS
jgi:hypothetical protein